MHKLITLFYKIYNWNWRWLVYLLQGCTIIFLILVASEYRLLPKNTINDFLVVSFAKEEKQNVILLETSQSMTEKQWKTIVYRLSKEWLAQKIVFTFIPQNASVSFFSKLKNFPVVFCGDTAEKPDVLQENEYYPFFLPEAENGICRYQYYQSAKMGVWGIESKVANISEEVTKEKFRISFSNEIISITTAQVLEKKLVSELIAGKIIIISLNNFESQIFTPHISNGTGIRIQEFQVHSINTLCNRSNCDEIAWEYRFYLLLLFFIIFFIVYRRINFYQYFVVSIFFVLTSVVLGIVLLNYYILLPLAEIILLQFIVIIFFIVQKSFFINKTFYDLYIKWSEYFRQNVYNDNFSDSWQHAIQTTCEYLHLSQSVLLKIQPKSYYVDTIAMVNCTPEDIREKRRDYRRQPYIDCKKSKQVCKLEKRLFFNKKNEQYLTPIVFSNQVLGFLVCAVSSNNRTKKFEAILASYGRYLGEIIFQEDLLAAKKSSGVVTEVEIFHQNLDSFLQLIQSKYQRYTTLVNNYSNPVVVYNLFGKILYMNEKASTFFHNEMITVENLTAPDFISRLSGYSLSQSKKIINSTVFNLQETNIPIDAIETGMQLKISPLHEDEGNVDVIICELIDKEDVISFADTAVLTKKITNSIRAELAKLMLSVSLLKSIGDSKLQSTIEMIEERMTVMNNVAEKCEYYLRLYQKTEEIPIYPVDACEYMEKICEKLKTIVTSKQIAWEVEKPQFPLPVMASAKLHKVFFILLSVLVDDAQKNSIIQITITESETQVVYSMSNSGIGIPQELLQKYLSPNNNSLQENLETGIFNTKIYKELNYCQQMVKTWKANLEATSTVGKGIKFSLQMNTF